MRWRNCTRIAIEIRKKLYEAFREALAAHDIAEFLFERSEQLAPSDFRHLERQRATGRGIAGEDTFYPRRQFGIRLAAGVMQAFDYAEGWSSLHEAIVKAEEGLTAAIDDEAKEVAQMRLNDLHIRSEAGGYWPQRDKGYPTRASVFAAEVTHGTFCLLGEGDGAQGKAAGGQGLPTFAARLTQLAYFDGDPDRFTTARALKAYRARSGVVRPFNERHLQELAEGSDLPREPDEFEFEFVSEVKLTTYEVKKQP